MDGVRRPELRGHRAGRNLHLPLPVHQSGTYWYHSHSRFQEQDGTVRTIVIERAPVSGTVADRDYTVLLSDWSDWDPEHLYANTQRQSDYFNFGKRTVRRSLQDVRRGLAVNVAERRMWGGMRMNPTDLPTSRLRLHVPDEWRGAGGQLDRPCFRRGEKVRLRFINSSSMSIFDVRIPGLKHDRGRNGRTGRRAGPVDEFRIGTARSTT